jgi:hypothetical protein
MDDAALGKDFLLTLSTVSVIQQEILIHPDLRTTLTKSRSSRRLRTLKKSVFHILEENWTQKYFHVISVSIQRAKYFERRFYVNF